MTLRIINIVLGDNMEGKTKVFIIVVILIILTIISTFLIKNINLHSYSLSIDRSSKDNEVKKDNSSIKEELTIEAGSEIPLIKDYFNNYEGKDTDTIKYFFNDQEISLDEISIIENDKRYLKGPNKYKVLINDKEQSILNIIDTKTPEVVTKDLTILENTTYNVKDFIVSYKDNSYDIDYQITYQNESDAHLTLPGSYEMILVICDMSNNCLDKLVNLTINKTNEVINTQVSNKYDETLSNNVYYLKDETARKVLTNTEEKYGVKIYTYKDFVYEVYSDGSKIKKDEFNEITEYDYSGFSFNMEAMKQEALSIYDNLNIIRDNILQSCNEKRNYLEIPSLKIDYDLNIIATIKAIEMAYSNNFSKLRPNNENIKSLYNDYLSYEEEIIIDDNIAKNIDESELIEYWTSNEESSNNILNPSYNKTGIAKYTLGNNTYYVQVFSS